MAEQFREQEQTSVLQHKLKRIDINARSLVSKCDQFEATSSLQPTWHDLKPDIIGSTESWTTSQVLDSELALSGYDLFRQNRPVNRECAGVLLYVDNSLHAVQLTSCAVFPEQVWCNFLDSTGHKYYVGVCYRTPSVAIYGSGQWARKHEQTLYTHEWFDFNYKYLQWPPTDDSSAADDATMFYHSLEDNFFTQHVQCATIHDAILDLVITDEPNLVNNVVDLGPFTGSDHEALIWTLQVRTELEPVTKHTFDYVKADIDSMKRELDSVNWANLLGDLSAEESCIVFRNKLREHRTVEEAETDGFGWLMQHI